MIQNDSGKERVGRYNTYGTFTMWFAGGGFKAGHVHGATDDFGHHAVTDVVHHYDLHANVAYLFGLDHTRLTYHRTGPQVTLTDGQPWAPRCGERLREAAPGLEADEVASRRAGDLVHGRLALRTLREPSYAASPCPLSTPGCGWPRR